MTLKVLYFDVETIPDYSRSDLWQQGIVAPDPPVTATPEEAAFLAQQYQKRQMKRMALQPEACQIVGLNVILGDGEPKSGWAGEINPATGQAFSESDLLTLFWSWAAQCPRLIGFNCLRFDIPVILTRSALLGVMPTVNFFDEKPWSDRVVDLLRRRFKDASRDSYMSLKALRRVLQLPIPEKYAEVMDNTGADVESLYLQFLAGDQEALRLLKLYGELDVLSTKLLAQLWSGYFFGRIE
jgi:predicted PolB exonuclease-like 3'-5' exonuclease